MPVVKFLRASGTMWQGFKNHKPMLNMIDAVLNTTDCQTDRFQLIAELCRMLQRAAVETNACSWHIDD